MEQLARIIANTLRMSSDQPVSAWYCKLKLN
jgi:hypothetical protein